MCVMCDDVLFTLAGIPATGLKGGQSLIITYF